VRRASLEAPKTKGEFCRTILESWRTATAMCSRLEGLTGSRFTHPHRGRRPRATRCLNNWWRCDRPQGGGGPIEATAAGNLLVQAIGAGEVSGIDEAREIVRQSFQIAEFQPKPESR